MLRDTVKVVALKPVAYRKIRMPGEVFMIMPGYAELYKRHGLLRLADEREGVDGADAVVATAPSPDSASAAAGDVFSGEKPRRLGKGSRKDQSASEQNSRGRYDRRDLRAAD